MIQLEYKEWLQFHQLEPLREICLKCAGCGHTTCPSRDSILKCLECGGKGDYDKRYEEYKRQFKHDQKQLKRYQEDLSRALNQSLNQGVPAS